MIIWQYDWFHINATLAYTWLLMGILSVTSLLITRRLRIDIHPSRWQVLVEVLVCSLRDQIADICQRDPSPYIPFIGTLFIFILSSNVLMVVPGFIPPTGSLSTTTALAICVFIAVPLFGITQSGSARFFHRYLEPTPLMLPFNLMGEVSRSVALAVRLYGNVMSGTVIGAILIVLIPFFFPVVMQMLGLVTGVIQAWIFAILATVYIASADDSEHRSQTKKPLNTLSAQQHLGNSNDRQ